MSADAPIIETPTYKTIIDMSKRIKVHLKSIKDRMELVDLMDLNDTIEARADAKAIVILAEGIDAMLAHAEDKERLRLASIQPQEES